MSGVGSSRRFVGALTLLTVRGPLLWVVVPLGAIFWLLLAVNLRRRGVGLGQFLGWLDLNLTSAIQRSVTRPFFDAPIPWTPFSAAVGLTHRIRPLDPV
jgi:hypothetical protein